MPKIQGQGRQGRPRLQRRIRLKTASSFFKPRGVPLQNLDIILLDVEELEALHLKNMLNLDQNTCAQKMNTSQSTFQRILSSAYKKISDALINNKAIKIAK